MNSHFPHCSSRRRRLRRPSNMQIYSSISFTLLFALHVIPTQSVFNFDSGRPSLRHRRDQKDDSISHSERIVEQLGKSGNDRTPTGRGETISQFFVKVNNENGRKLALQYSHKIVKHLNDGIMVVRANSTAFRALQSHEDIDNVEIDYPVWGLTVESSSSKESVNLGDVHRDLRERTPYGIPMIQADQLGMGDHNVTVCVIDSGIAIHHPDLDPSTISGDDNIRTPDLKWDKDLSGHGTQIAGIISSTINNDRGIRGVGKILLHITRALDDQMQGYESDIFDSITQCIYRGSKIITLSLGGIESSDYMRGVYEALVQEYGILLFSAAGNDGNTTNIYPASHPAVISIGAVTENRDHAWFSNFNDQVELVAPGTNILSTGLSTTAIFTDDYSYPAYKVGSHVQEVDGVLVNCGDGSQQCWDAVNKICIIQPDMQVIETSISNCQAGGGIGVIMYWGTEHHGNWHFVHSGIPVVSIDTQSGLDIISDIANTLNGKWVRIAYSGPNERQYTYTYNSGTSMACPYAAGAAAKLWSHFPYCSNHHIRYALARTAYRPDDNACDNQLGYGLIQIHEAYQYLLNNECNDSWPNNTSQGGCTTLI